MIFCIFYEVSSLFLHQFYVKSPLPIKLLCWSHLTLCVCITGESETSSQIQQGIAIPLPRSDVAEEQPPDCQGEEEGEGEVEEAGHGNGGQQPEPQAVTCRVPTHNQSINQSINNQL